jgi:hypothetical protein
MFHRSILGVAGAWSLALATSACGDDGGNGSGILPECRQQPPLWFEESVPTDEALLGVWGRRSDDVFAVGWNGTILHYDGAEWTEEPVETTRTATLPLTTVGGVPLPNDFDPMDPTFVPGPVWAAGWRGTILERSPEGVWVDAPRAPGTATVTADLFSLAVDDEMEALVVGDTGTLFIWDGSAWDRQALRVRGTFSNEFIEPRGTLHGAWTRNGDTYFAVGSAGAAYRSRGGPMDWEIVDTTIPNPLRAVWGPNPNNVFAVGLDSLILRFDGGTWAVVRNRGADELPVEFIQDIDGRNGNNLMIVGWRGFVARFDGRWRVEEVPTDRDLRGVWMADDANVAFVVGADGTVLRRDTRPLEAWQELCMPTGDPMTP